MSVVEFMSPLAVSRRAGGPNNIWRHDAGMANADKLPEKGRGLKIVAVLSLALFARLALIAASLVRNGDASRFASGDTASYVRPATGLLTTGRFESAGQPELHRTPGYPLLLTVGLAVGQVELGTLGLQTLLSVAGVYCAYRLTRCVFSNERAALFAALLYACEPLSIIYTAKLLSETLFTTFAAATLWLTAEYLRRPSWKLTVAMAALLAAMPFIRPVAYYYPFCIAGGLLAYAVVSRERFLLALQVLMLLLAARLPVALWEWHNRHAADYDGFCSIGDENLYFYNAAALEARQRGVTLLAVQNELGYCDPARYFALHSEQRVWTEAQRYRFMHDTATAKIKSAPLTYATIHLRGLAPIVLGTGATELAYLLAWDSSETQTALAEEGLLDRVRYYATRQPAMLAANVALAAYPVALWVLAGGGALSWFFAAAFRSAKSTQPERRSIAFWPLALLCGTMVYYALLTAGPAGSHRMRHPMMPELCVLAAGYLAIGYQRTAKKDRKPRDQSSQSLSANRVGVYSSVT